MSFTPNIQVFCCHYTSQQAIAEGDDGLRKSGFPEGAVINRLSCSGKLQVSTILKAFEKGADGVCVVGCPVDKCHNLMGSQRAAHRVSAVKKALEELGAGGDRIEMSHLERGFHPEFIETAKIMMERVLEMGPSPFRDAMKPVADKAEKKAGKETAKKVVEKPAAAKKSVSAKSAAAKPAGKAAKAPVKKAARKGGKK
ncbi:MAG: hydrogenase iron-sulfur subunit [Proteobacteria bacterium]|nr:hydrogenase iron-sulfur subunit [Pseudomonadota bacterium]MBU1736913.1 hydrogenase iron-sulfur subunit [Pseudomonadota bacterium]